MEVVPHTNGGGDSGVETDREFDIESNDSSMSSLSVGGGGGAGEVGAGGGPSQLGPPPSLGEPVSPPLAQPAEDGYLGDCSSDGEGRKNFPLPPDWQHQPSRHSLPPSPGAPTPAQRETYPTSATQSAQRIAAHFAEISQEYKQHEDVEPPAGIQFSALISLPESMAGPGPGNCAQGYQLREAGPANQSNLKTKIRPAGFRSKFNRAVPDDWARVRAAIAERKLRLAANTNNTEMLERLLAQNGTKVDVRCVDEHKRSPLHFAAAKGYSEVVAILLQHGADPNQKDQLGNTAMHLAACTNHVPVVTLLLRAGTDLNTIDNNGRTPLQLAQAKLKLLQRNSGQGGEMNKVKAEVESVLEMMREYLRRVNVDSSADYHQLLSNFSQRLTLHTTSSGLSNDLGSLLESLGGLQISNGSQGDNG